MIIWIVSFVGSFVLLVTLVLVVRRSGPRPIEKPTHDWPASPEAQVWTAKMNEAGGDFGLASVRAAAKGWGASIAALLGVFAAVAVVKGPDSLTAVGGWQAQVAAWMILAAAGIAMIAILLAALAEQGVPVWQKDLDGWKYKNLTLQRAQQAAAQVRWSRYLVIVVLFLVSLAMGVTWLSAVNSVAPQPVHAIVVSDFDVRCGVVATLNGVVTLQIGKSPAASPITNVRQVTIVSKCP
jgi:hypothetical protein